MTMACEVGDAATPAAAIRCSTATASEGDAACAASSVLNAMASGGMPQLTMRSNQC